MRLGGGWGADGRGMVRCEEGVGIEAEEGEKLTLTERLKHTANDTSSSENAV